MRLPCRSPSDHGELAARCSALPVSRGRAGPTQAPRRGLAEARSLPAQPPAQCLRPARLCSSRLYSTAEAEAPLEEVSGVELEGSFTRTSREDIRNIAIIAHVDHGKTTLVDAMLRQSNIFREGTAMQDRIMDSNDLERERGITILSKNTAVRFKGIKINIIDTPGHADFGGEVERVLNMCDGVLLLVDAVEGPMPQTRFVLRKALDLNKKVVVVVNKVDRPASRPDYVIDTTFDLFVELGATDEQLDFPIVYASGQNGTAGPDPDSLAPTLEPLFDCIVENVSPPAVRVADPLQLLVTNLDYDDFKGRLGIGRVTAGHLMRGEQIIITRDDQPPRPGKISELFVYDNFSRVPVERVEAGDICAFAGLSNASIGETINNPASPRPLPSIEVELPTVRMAFMVNTSAFAGNEGKYVTSRNLRERLMRELERNLALRVEDGDAADSFIVSGRGTLHISILIENMRREGYEMAVGPPRVITKKTDQGTLEPFENAYVEVPEEHVGPVVDLLGSRKGQMLDMSVTAEGLSLIKYRIPTRGLLGLRNAMLTSTKGTAVLNTNFADYAPSCGEIMTRELGSLTAWELGTVTAYAMESTQQRGRMFVNPGEDVYENQVIGIHQRAGDLKVNVCKKKALTNMRSANKEQGIVLNDTIQMGLDDALEYIADDELVEVTPLSVRIRKNPAMLRRGR
ncbi:hypothetical protein WJX73_002120 [Symbiochloris irregularis]|uniref:Tr-type G domain-containing protein n=1 Tax=Symbiochloris irregularis TaxID=706552 RepID=A0AAW1NUC5_9CHLO